jgi:Recombination endonuclease VII
MPNPAPRFEETDDLENSKVCTICKKRLPLKAFHKNRLKSDGLQTRCRNCYRDWYNQRYEESSEFRDKRKNHFREFYQEKYPERRQRQNDDKMFRKYGMTRKEFDAMSKAQDDLCAICKRFPEGKTRLSVDHCHKTLKVRGLLCDKCNIGIGMFQDDPQLLAAAIRYLTPHPSPARVTGTITKNPNGSYTFRYWVNGKQREKTFRDIPGQSGSGQLIAQDFQLKFASSKAGFVIA